MHATPQFSLTHIVREPLEPEERRGRPPLLLMLHGVGSHERDLFELAPYMDGRFHVVSARAPFTLAPGAYAWFHVQFTPTGPIINPQEAEQSRQVLILFIGELVQAYDLDPKRVYLLGFSQGAIMSFSVALTRPDVEAGVVAHSGRILPEIKPLIAPPEQLRGLPVFVVHGLYDEVLPIHYGRAARDLLSALPVDLTYREYPIGHHVSADTLSDIQAWLKERLDGQGSGIAG